jgi:hypothetical protein
MSQYPSPYSPPPGDPRDAVSYDMMTRDPIGPARNAGTLMLVLGVLMLLYGTCNGISSLTTTNEQFVEEMQKISNQPSPIPVGMMRTLGAIFSGAIVVLAIFMLVVSPYVRRGGSTAIMVALVGVSVIVGLLALGTFICILAGIAMPIAFILACVMAIPTVLFGLLLYFLFQAKKSTSYLHAMQLQYQQQYLMYQQTMQQYGQASFGYGYSYPAPAPPPEPGDKPKAE